MKKYFIITIALFIGLAVNGQQIFKELSSGKSGTYVYNGSALRGDTVKKNTSKNYDFYTGSLFNTFQAQVLSDTITGKPKTRYYVYQSPDYVNWYYIDSSRTVTGGATNVTAKTSPFNPYIRLIAKGVDSTQKTLVQKIIITYKTE